MNTFYQIDYIDENKVSHYCDIIRNRDQAIRKVNYLNEINEKLNTKTRFECNLYKLIEIDITGINKLSEYAEQQARFERGYYRLRG